ncbi:LysE family transporter [Ectobacillus panaciterrae]|uniref:LysE family transporter n=1 Tax=Ectobacillus panaciterrae TaxID=363872 RepID=UPI000424A3EE|nr:LysE family transporter [Ectobacillus panaciterrae]
MNKIDTRIETIINEYHEEKRLSGTILISKNYNIIFERAYGDASIQLGVPNKLEMKFHIASMTKMFIATAALKLYGEGKINLDHHPSTYLTEIDGLHSKINPKVAVFFLTFLPQFVEPTQGTFLSFLLLGLTYCFIKFVWYIIYIYMIDMISGFMKKPLVQGFFEGITGLVFISFGVKLALEKNS